jgi:hypothetical protein
MSSVTTVVVGGWCLGRAVGTDSASVVLLPCTELWKRLSTSCVFLRRAKQRPIANDRSQRCAYRRSRQRKQTSEPWSVTSSGINEMTQHTNKHTYIQ